MVCDSGVTQGDTSDGEGREGNSVRVTRIPKVVGLIWLALVGVILINVFHTTKFLDTVQDEICDSTRDSDTKQPERRMDDDSATGTLTHLTDATFDTFLQDYPVVFVNFYAPWCGFSRALSPTWEKFALVSETAVVASVDCTVSYKVCSKQGITGYPYLRLYYGDEQKMDYKKSRNVDALTEFVRLTLAGEWNENNRMPSQYDGDNDDSEAMDSERDSDDESGDESHDEVVSEEYVPESDVSDEVDAESGGDESGMWSDRKSSDYKAPTSMDTSKVVTLTDDTFDAVVRKHENVFVMYRLSPTWTQFASRVSQLPVLVAEVDCQEHPKTCRKQKVKAYPSLRWYRDGKPVASDYKNDHGTDALIKYSKNMLNISYDDEEEEAEEASKSGERN